MSCKWMVRARRFSLILFVFAGCAPPPPATNDTQTASSRTCVQVVLVRGLWDVYSTGLNDMNDQLVAEGYESEAISGPDWPNAADALTRRFAGHKRPEKIVLIGHSYGADQAILIAERLQAAHINVALLFLLDATDPHTIPANVDRCIHFYLPNELGDELPTVFAGNPVEASPGNTHTIIENHIPTPGNFGPAVEGVDHLNIDSSPFLHALIDRRVQELCTAPAKS